MQCGTLTWTLDVFSFISAWHFSIVAGSHCSLQLRFSISCGRGQGRATIGFVHAVWYFDLDS